MCCKRQFTFQRISRGPKTQHPKTRLKKKTTRRTLAGHNKTVVINAMAKTSILDRRHGKNGQKMLMKLGLLAMFCINLKCSTHLICRKKCHRPTGALHFQPVIVFTTRTHTHTKSRIFRLKQITFTGLQLHKNKKGARKESNNEGKEFGFHEPNKKRTWKRNRHTVNETV